MEDVQIKLSALWVARMLTGLQGDTLRFMQPGMMEQIAAGEVGGMRMSNELLLAASLFMVIPIAMVVLALLLPYRINRWANIIAAALIFLLDLAGLPTYGASYAVLLIVVGLIFNGMTIWLAWNWKSQKVEPA